MSEHFVEAAEMVQPEPPADLVGRLKSAIAAELDRQQGNHPNLRDYYAEKIARAITPLFAEREKADVIIDDGLSANPLNMGSPAAAAQDLAARAVTYREFRQPIMGTAASLKQRDVQERQALFQLGQAALQWLWHREHAAKVARIGGSHEAE